MQDKLFEYLTEAVSRRSVLQRMTQAAMAIGLTLIGADVARATFSSKCCVVCVNPASCSHTNCSCQWCWTCCFDTGPGHDFFVYSCDECYSALGGWCNPASICPRTTLGHSPGSDGCDSIKCSRITKVNPPISCEPPPDPPGGDCDELLQCCADGTCPGCGKCSEIG